MRAGAQLGDLTETAIGRAAIGKAVIDDGDLVGCTSPAAYQPST